MFMERKNGYLILDDEKVVRTIPRNQGGNIFTFSLEGEEYFFKECPLSNALLEIFCSCVAAHLQIPTVSNDLAILNGFVGVLSNSYNPNALEEISLQTILMKYYIDVLVDNEQECSQILDFNDLYNLEDIQKSLFHFFPSDVATCLFSEVIDSFLLQCFLGNPDVHSTQLTILLGDEPHLSMNHDYERACTVNFNQSVFSFDLKVKRNSSKKCLPRDIIQDFFSYEHSLYFEYFCEKVNLLPSKEVVLQQMQSQLGFFDFSFLNFFLSNYESYRQELEELVLDFKNPLRSR